MGLTGSAESNSLISNVRAPHKMVFVVNTALKMGNGKMAAQVGHAAVSLYMIAQRKSTGALDHWISNGAMKVVVRGDNADQLVELYGKAQKAGLSATLIQDAGRTQILAGSRTVLGVFGPCDEVDRITGHLKLL